VTLLSFLGILPGGSDLHSKMRRTLKGNEHGESKKVGGREEESAQEGILPHGIHTHQQEIPPTLG